MWKPLGAALAALLLGSCGGGGGSDTVGVAGGTAQIASSRAPVQAKRRGADRPLAAEPARVVNTNRLGDQRLRMVGATGDGGYVVAWSTGGFLSMQAFDDEGERAGPETRIQLEIPAPTADASRQAIEESQLAVLTDGSLVVAYRITRDTTTGVYFQIFGKDGTLLVPETQVASQAFAGQQGPFLKSAAVVALSDGGFVLASTLSTGFRALPNRSDVTLHWFDRQGHEVAPRADVSGLELSYSIAADAHGGVTVVTNALDLSHGSQGFLFQAIHFDATHVGTVIASSGSQRLDLLPLENGYVLFTLGAQVTMQMLDSQGHPVGASQTVAVPYRAFELADGSFVVISLTNGVYAAQRLTADGTAIGQPLAFDTHGGLPGEVALTDGGFVAAWSAPGAAGDADVYAQRFVQRPNGRHHACLDNAKAQDLKGRARKAFVDACEGDDSSAGNDGT